MIRDGEGVDFTKPMVPTADRVHHALAKIETDVVSGIQPEVRELRMLMADVRHLTSLAFKRIFRMVLAILGVNVLTLIVVVLLLS
jgi:hypothetical protein